MAKAAEIKGLDAAMTYSEAAARTVAVRGEEVFAHSGGVLDTGDIERVHAMRVATRRLRAVIEVYAPCFDREQLRPVLRDVKDLADALGARRDPDVELLALEQFAVSMGPDERPGVELFIDRTRAEQREGNRLLAEALDHIERTDLRGRIAALAASAREHRPKPVHARPRHAHTAAGDGSAQPAPERPSATAPAAEHAAATAPASERAAAPPPPALEHAATRAPAPDRPAPAPAPAAVPADPPAAPLQAWPPVGGDDPRPRNGGAS
jgi:hypothetical protein